jgi:metallophosphoesterase (TIGR00282 family)
MNILYLGDIMGKSGRNVVTQLLPELRREHSVDFVVAQGENLSHGKGLEPAHVEAMMAAGVDAFSAGNWTGHRPAIIPWLEDPSKPLVRCANYPKGTPGRGYKIIDTPMGKVLIASLLGQIVGFYEHVVDNPLLVIDQILAETKHEPLIARIINFHGDYSSEKLVIGRYLDGRATAVIGDHWHVPTADAKLLPGGTAHITDVGMVGSYDSCLGVNTDVIIKRWLTDERSRNELEENGQMWLCGVLIEVDTANGLSKGIKQIIKFV